MTNSLVDRWNRGCDSLPLLQEADQTITQLHAAVKTAQELAATRLMEIERLREVLTIPNITPDTTSSALFIRTLSEHEKGQPVNAQDLINALMWRVKNQRREIARLREKRCSPEPLEPRSAELAWGLESKLPGGDWKVYWALYSDRDRAEQAAKNGRPEGTEWRVVTYARMPEGASRDASSEPKCGLCGKPGITEFMRTCCAEGRARDLATARTAKRASPADLVGALQDVVHTDPGPVRAGRAIREWHFDRYRSGKLMAQGVKVHAVNYAEAYDRAIKLLFIEGNKPTDELRLSERT